MKSSMMFLASLAFVSAGMFACSDDDEVKRKGDPDVQHSGDQWKISTMEYTLVDQSTSGQTFKSGSRENAGTFYFVSGGAQGSFEMEVEGYNKEDLFAYSIDANGQVSIITVSQSAGATTNQNVMAISGSSSGTDMTLDGTITKQSTAGQFILTVSMTLVKQ